MVTLFATPARPSRCVWQRSLFCTTPERGGGGGGGGTEPNAETGHPGYAAHLLYVFVPFDLVYNVVQRTLRVAAVA